MNGSMNDYTLLDAVSDVGVWVWFCLRIFRHVGWFGCDRRPALQWGRLVCAFLSYGVALASFVDHQWFNMIIYSFACVSDFYDWWHDDENKRKRKKLWDRVKRRVRRTSTGRLGVSET